MFIQKKKPPDIVERLFLLQRVFLWTNHCLFMNGRADEEADSTLPKGNKTEVLFYLSKRLQV